MSELDWQQQALLLANTGVMSWRSIAKQLDVRKSTCSDFLRSYYRMAEDAKKDGGAGTTHLVIFDTQVRKDVPLDYLSWIGYYIVRKLPDVLVLIGDHADMESLSSYDKGKRSAEGKRVQEDIAAAVEGMQLLLAPMRELQERQRAAGEPVYNPRMVLTLGNHEDRINRHVNANPELHGFLSIDDLQYEEFGWEVYPFLTPVEIDGVHYCLAPHHKVLTSKLKYVELGALEIGDELLAFDEFSPEGSHRKYKKSIVLKHDLDYAELFKVTLSSGKTFNTTAEHQWLIKKGTATLWCETKDLKIGVTQVANLFPEWESLDTYEAGWLAGILDGEGCLAKPNSAQGGIQLSFSQNDGLVLDKALGMLDRYDVEYNTHPSKECNIVRILGTSGDKLKLLGMLGAERLVKKFDPEMLGRVQKRDNVDNEVVVSVEPLGVGEIVKIETSTKTMIVEGYGHHNCHYFPNVMTGKPLGGTAANMLTKIGTSFTMGHQQLLDIAVRTLQTTGQQQWGVKCGASYVHDETYKGVQGNKHWRGIMVKHNVKDGSYDPLMISMDWLRKEYGQ